MLGVTCNKEVWLSVWYQGRVLLTYESPVQTDLLAYGPCDEEPGDQIMVTRCPWKKMTPERIPFKNVTTAVEFVKRR